MESRTETGHWTLKLSHRIIHVGKGLQSLHKNTFKSISMPTQPYCKVPGLVLMWNTSRNGESTTSLEILFQGLTTLSVMNFFPISYLNLPPISYLKFPSILPQFFPISYLNLPWCNLRPCPLIVSLFYLGAEPDPHSLSGSCRE